MRNVLFFTIFVSLLAKIWSGNPEFCHMIFVLFNQLISKNDIDKNLFAGVLRQFRNSQISLFIYSTDFNLMKEERYYYYTIGSFWFNSYSLFFSYILQFYFIYNYNMTFGTIDLVFTVGLPLILRVLCGMTVWSPFSLSWSLTPVSIRIIRCDC